MNHSCHVRIHFIGQDDPGRGKASNQSMSMFGWRLHKAIIALACFFASDIQSHLSVDGEERG